MAIDRARALALCLALAGTVLTGRLAAAAERGVTASEVKLGASAILTGPQQGTAYVNGARLYFDAVNAAGGVHGRKISYTVLDDAFDVKRSVENHRKLITEQNVFMVFGNIGTGNTLALLPLLESTNTLAFAPISGAPALRQEVHRHLFHVRPSYSDDARSVVSHLKTLGITRAAVFY